MKAYLQHGKGAHSRRHGRAGQVMLEYMVTTGLLLGVATILAILLYAFKEFGDRVLDLIAFELP